MTEKVNPSPNRPADAFTTAGAIAYGGGSRDGYIVQSSEPTELSKQDSGITESNLNNFEESSSSTSLTVSIGPGEAFIFGSWVVSDNIPSANVILQAGVTDQTVYLGWNKDSPDDVIIGLESEFSTTATNNDQKIELYSYDTDSNGVISKTDLRQIGPKNTASNTETENLTLAGNSLDSDGDGVFDNDDVNALSSFGQGDSFNAYPLTNNDIGALSSLSQGDSFNAYPLTNNDVSALSNLNSGDTFNSYPLSPSQDLSTDTITVSTGDGINDGGSVSLGGSTTISVDVSDFTGSGLTPDGNNNIDLSNDSISVSTGTDLTGGGTVSLGGSISISHQDTSTQSNVGTGGNTVIDDINLDGNGHVTNMNTENRSLNDWTVPNDFNINNASKIGLPHRSSDPGANPGDMWYRTDLD